LPSESVALFLGRWGAGKGHGSTFRRYAGGVQKFLESLNRRENAQITAKWENGESGIVQFANRFVHNTNGWVNGIPLASDSMNVGHTDQHTARPSGFAAKGVQARGTLFLARVP
jgi:hypothetical protein